MTRSFLFTLLPAAAAASGANVHASVSADGQIVVDDVLETAAEKFVDVNEELGIDVEDSFSEISESVNATQGKIDPTTADLSYMTPEFATCCTAGGLAGCHGPPEEMAKDAALACTSDFDCMDDNTGEFDPASPLACLCGAGITKGTSWGPRFLSGARVASDIDWYTSSGGHHYSMAVTVPCVKTEDNHDNRLSLGHCGTMDIAHVYGWCWTYAKNARNWYWMSKGMNQDDHRVVGGYRADIPWGSHGILNVTADAPVMEYFVQTAASGFCAQTYDMPTGDEVWIACSEFTGVLAGLNHWWWKLVSYGTLVYRGSWTPDKTKQMILALADIVHQQAENWKAKGDPDRYVFAEKEWLNLENYARLLALSIDDAVAAGDTVATGQGPAWTRGHSYTSQFR